MKQPSQSNKHRNQVATRLVTVVAVESTSTATASLSAFNRSIVPVRLSDLEDALLFADVEGGYTNQVYIERATGKLFYVSEETELDEYPEDADNLERYAVMPTKAELDLNFGLVRAFALEHLAAEDADRVFAIIRRKGAYRRFKSWLAARELLAQWHDFESERTEAALRQWCAENGIKLEG